MSTGQAYWADMEPEEYNRRMKEVNSSTSSKKSIFQEKPNVQFFGKVIVTNKCIHIIRNTHEHCKHTTHTS